MIVHLCEIIIHVYVHMHKDDMKYGYKMKIMAILNELLLTFNFFHTLAYID